MLNINFIRLKDICIEENIYYQPMYTSKCVICDSILKISNDYKWKLIVNGHKFDGSVITDLPEILNQDNISVLYAFFNQKLQFAKVIDFPDILERRNEIKQPFPSLSKERLALVESSLGKTKLMKSNFDTIKHPECFLVATKLEICGECTD